jgi:hypothetical protein
MPTCTIVTTIWSNHPLFARPTSLARRSIVLSGTSAAWLGVAGLARFAPATSREMNSLLDREVPPSRFRLADKALRAAPGTERPLSWAATAAMNTSLSESSARAASGEEYATPPMLAYRRANRSNSRNQLFSRGQCLLCRA